MYLKIYNLLGLALSLFLLLQGIALLFTSDNFVNRTANFIFNNKLVGFIQELKIVNMIFGKLNLEQILRSNCFRGCLRRNAVLRNIFFGQLFYVSEVLNILMGASKSPILSVSLQIASRVFISFILFAANNLPNTAFVSSEIPRATLKMAVMFISWYIADSIRFGYYLLRTKYLKKLRYNAFLVLYPIGVMLEIYFVNSLDSVDMPYMSVFLRFVMIAYLPGFTYLYFYMIRRRRLILRKKNKRNRS